MSVGMGQPSTRRTLLPWHWTKWWYPRVSTRNTAERNGLINVEFVVTVPKVLQKRQLDGQCPSGTDEGDVPDSLKELRFTGQRFREAQERDYRRYDRFVEKIIPDSVNFYRTYVNYRSFERYLERLKWYKRGLERRWAITGSEKNPAGPSHWPASPMFKQPGSPKTTAC